MLLLLSPDLPLLPRPRPNRDRRADPHALQLPHRRIEQCDQGALFPQAHGRKCT